MDSGTIRKLMEHPGYGPAPESDARVRKWLKKHRQKFDHFINGDFCVPAQGGYFPTIDPSTGKELAQVAQGTEEDVDAAVAAAKAAFPAWSALPAFERAKYLYAMHRAILRLGRIFAVLESLINGKTIRETRDIDIPLAAHWFSYFAGMAQAAEEDLRKFQPGGVVAAIIPWNFPFMMLAWKIAAAIAVGNTVILKPSEFTSLTALLFAEILRDEMDLPPGVINIVTGDGKTGEALVKHPIPWKIAFTGSTEVGKRIIELTAGTGKHRTMELGGKSPFVVCANADLDAAVEGVVRAIWFNYGQVCCAGSRLLVEESIFDEFIRRLKARMQKLRGGVPLDKGKDFGAVSSEVQLRKIQELVELGRREGAEIFQPEGWTCPPNGYHFPPTLCTKVSPAGTLAQIEVFGPVLVAMRFRTYDEAVKLANNTRYGLAASVWSQDIAVALSIATKLRAGTVWVNDTNMFHPGVPFGGFGDSGFGREGSWANIFDLMIEQFPEVSPPESIEVAAPLEIRNQRRGIDRTRRFLIAGKLARPDGGTSFPIKDGAGKLLGMLGDANTKDVRNAVKAARSAADSWAATPADTRARILRFLAENLDTNRENYAIVIAAQTGCSVDSGQSEVDLAVERLFLWAARAETYEGRIPPVTARVLAATLNKPMGVIGVRAPDDHPLLGVVGTLGPALAMGNTLVLVAGKHGITALDFVQVIQISDIPGGVVNIVTAEDPDAIAEVMAKHEDVDAIWCWGPPEVCAKVERASTSNVKETWVSHGKPSDWRGPQGKSLTFLRKATKVQVVWVPFGA